MSTPLGTSPSDPRDPWSQSDRWGLFIGEWAPTFFALGVGMKLEESEQNSTAGALHRETE